jgi:hypothetical protein
MIIFYVPVAALQISSEYDPLAQREASGKTGIGATAI